MIGQSHLYRNTLKSTTNNIQCELMTNKKLWGGAFSQTATPELEEFWNSIPFDYRLIEYDILGSMAHAQMLGTTGIISADESKKIIGGLKTILEDYKQGKIEFRLSDEDIHMNVERYLHEYIGVVAGKLHTARSRNDQVALDMHLYVRDMAQKTINLLEDFIGSLINQAEKNLSTIMPGYTHLQRAQPVLFAHHIMAYAWMFHRDIMRMRAVYESASLSPLGAGAIAGTTHPIDREQTAATLGMSGLYANSMDAVSNRDYAIEMLMANVLISTHLSRLCEEIILWVSSEFGFVKLSDAYCTGSSMMPQKKNADLAELVRGKTGRVFGDLITMLTVLKGTPLTYNKDFQEDKECLFDSVDTVQKSLFHMTGMIETMQTRPDNMLKATKEGFLNATDVADYLVKKGIPFRETHEISAKIVAHCLDRNITINDLNLPELQTFHQAFDSDIAQAIDIEHIVNQRTSQGGTARSAVVIQIQQLKNEIKKS
jgi:argininosuccinate lyase